jgi:hypothetical protein
MVLRATPLMRLAARIELPSTSAVSTRVCSSKLKQFIGLI